MVEALPESFECHMFALMADMWESGSALQEPTDMPCQSPAVSPGLTTEARTSPLVVPINVLPMKLPVALPVSFPDATFPDILVMPYAISLEPIPLSVVLHPAGGCSAALSDAEEVMLPVLEY